MKPDAEHPGSSAPSLSPGVAVHHAVDRDARGGEMVEVFGIYEPVDVGKSPEGTTPDHAAVRLADGALVYLLPPWHPDAVRSPEERARYAGRAVVAKGILFVECPPPPGGGAYLVVACLYPEVVVMERRVYDLLHSGKLA